MAGPDFSSFGTLVDEAKTPAVPDFAKVDAGGDKKTAPHDFSQFGTPVDEPKASGHALDQPGRFSLSGNAEPGYPEQASTLARNLVSSLGVGHDTAAADLRELVGRVPVVGEKLKAAGDALDRALSLQSPDEALKKASKNFTPEYQESREKKWWDDKEHWFGPAWTDPRSYTSGFLESLPEEAMTMGPAMRLAKVSYTTALLKTGSEKLAANAAARTAMIVGGATEGALAGAQSSRQVRDDIKNLPEDTLRQSDAVKGLMSQGKSFQDAVDQVANDGATKAFFLAGVSTGIFSGMGDRVLAKLILGGETNLAKRVIKGAVTEGVLEEFPQSYLQQISQNYAMQEANPKQDLFDDALNQGLAGLAIGAAQGGGMAGVFGRNAKAAPSTPLSSEDVLGKEGATPPPPPGGGTAPPLALPAPKRDIVVDAQGNAREATSPEAEQADLQRRAAEEQQRVSREELGNTSPDAKRTDIEEQRAQAVRDNDFAKLDELNSKQAAVQKEAAFTEREQAAKAKTAREQTGLDRLAEQQRNERAPNEPTAMQLAMRKAGVTREQFATAPKDEATRQLEASQGRVLRTNPAEVSDGTLQFVAQSGQGQAKVVAQSELDRRDAVRAAGPTEQDRPVAEKLFNGERLTQDERHRMVELGLGHQRGDGRWVISQRGRDYRAELRQQRGQAVAQKLGQPAMRRENDQALVERLNARSGEKYQLATPEHLPADAKIGARIAESFGKRVLYVEGPRGTAGYVMPEDPNTIYINVNTKNPLITVIGHELLHTLRRTNEAVYKQLLDRLVPLMHNVQEYRDWLKAALAQEGQSLSEKEFLNLAHEELLADFMGDHMMQPKFWVEVFRGQQRSWIEKVRDAVHLALDAIRMRMAIGGKRGWGTERYIKDTDAVRRAMAEAYNAWRKQQTEKLVKPQATSQPALASRERATREEQYKKAEDEYQRELKKFKAAKAYRPEYISSDKIRLRKKEEARDAAKMALAQEKAERAELQKKREERNKAKLALAARGVNVEVAPNPENKEATARFDALDESMKKDATYRVAESVIPKIMEDMGIADFHVQYTIGGYEGKTNPSLIVTFGEGVPYDQVLEAGRVIGWSFNQQAIIGYDEYDKKGKDSGGFVKVKPSRPLTYEEQSALFKAINGAVPQASGFTGRENDLVFGNFSDLEHSIFHDKIYAAVGAIIEKLDYDASTSLHRFRSDWVQPVTLEGTRYGQGNEKAGEAGREGVRGQGRAYAFRTEAERTLGEAISSSERSTTATGAGTAGPGVTPLRARERLDTGIKLTRAERGASLDIFVYGDQVPPQYRTVKQAAEFIEEHVLTLNGGKNRAAYTEENAQSISKIMAHEALLAIDQAKSSIGWYRKSLEGAIEVAAQKHPEIATDPDARFAFTYALAVTSNGTTVRENTRYAFEVYEKYQDHGGKMPYYGKGPRKPAMARAFMEFNFLKKELGSVAALREFMLTKHPVQTLRMAGYPIRELIDEEVYGGTVIGSKIGGGFLQNLNGNYDALTIDRWFMRMWGRMTGQLVSQRISPSGLIDSPLNPGMRTQARRAVDLALAQLKERGKRLTVSDLQALLWYPEKDFYKMLGVADENAAPTDYYTEVKRYVEDNSDATEEGLEPLVSPDRGRRGHAATEPGRGGETRASSQAEAAQVDQAAHEAATSPQNALPQPTAAQAEAGNYQKGHVTIAGLDVSIENPEGSQRRPEWPALKSHYGYIRGTIGKDKDHLDVFIKPGTPRDYAGPVFVIDQKKTTGHFDEHKVMLGWATMPEARAGYSENYSKGWDGVRAIVRFENPEAFKAWLEHGDTKAPVETQAPLMAREREPQPGYWEGPNGEFIETDEAPSMAERAHELAFNDRRWYPKPKQGDVLRARERDQTETAAFKKWFGDSKVVDAEGKPLVVYHGTFSDFKRFETGQHTTEGAAFFTVDSEVANSFADPETFGHDLNDVQPNVRPVFLSIKNPMVVGAKAVLTKDGDHSFDVMRAVVSEAREKGHDGLHIKNVRDGGKKADQWAVFKPSQIKSAIGNRGTFDPNDANILRSREGRPVEDVVDELRTMWRDTSERPGKKFEFGLELERRPNGDWVSPDSRFEIERTPDGYYAKVDGIEIGWGRDFQRARSHLLAKFKEEVKAGNIINPMEARSVFARYAPEQQAAVVTAWKKIASLPNAFRFASSEATDLKTIAKDMGVDRVIAKIDGFSMNEPEGNTGWINIDFIDGTTAVLHFSDAEKTAYLNASEMNKGGYGAQLYQSVLTWAANNKYVLVPDPGGLSLTNAYRRTEQMISASLRLDTTRYMRPHADQGLYGWINEPKTKAEEDHNFALMLLTSYENVYKSQADTKSRTKVLAELSKLRYNFEHGRFEHDGEPATNREWGQLAHLDQSSFVGSGVTTLQRAVLTQSILEAARDRSGKGVATLVSQVPARGIADEDHPLRGVLYARERDTGGGKVPGAGGASAGGVVRRAALATARGAVAAARPVTAALDLANRAAETALKLPAKLLVAPVTSRLYDRVVGIGRAMAQKNAFAQEVAHGLIADYGLPEPYLDARQDRESRINAVLRQSKDMIDKIASLDRAEARVAYLWMQEAPSSAQEQQLLAQLPESSRQALAQMKEQIDQLGQEAVRLGLLSPESFERNRMAYLHRTYKKYELENPQAVARSGRAKAIKADAYRGRGLRDDIAASRVPGAQAGDHYTRLELREPATEGLGALKRVVYLKAGIPIPSTYAGWRQDGTWEARWFDPKKPDRVGMWRDLTPEERQRLGEIDEVRYAFARTMLATTRDIETARFLKHVATNYAKPNEDAVIEAGGRIAEAVDSMVTLTTYADNEWVQVPTGYAAGTKIRKYGALAGQFVPGHIWNDIRSTINVKSGAAVWRLYDQLLRGWKISKTALSPVVHTNNVMSNFVLADMANVHFEDTRRALRTIIDAQRGNEAARTMMERYYDSGAEGGSQSAIELRKEIIEPFLAELEREQDQTLAHVGLIQALSLAIHGNLRQSLAAFSGMKSTQLAAIPFKVMIEAYRSEDAVFRLAKFIKETEAGKTDREAGKEARAAFLDYNINAPWIQALRRGPLPFVSFSYRAIPLLIQTAAKQPWKMMKYFAVGYGLNALAYAMLGNAGDEDKERKLMPDEKSGRALGVFYRMLRMPWNDEHGSPVFFDVRRWIPGGDIVDLTGSQSAIPLPSWMSIGGPLSLMIELVANKDLQSGRSIVKESDTAGEAVTKISDHLFKFASPNLPVPNPLGYAADFLADERGLYQTYSWKSIQAAGTGETDAFGRERSLPQSIASSVGFKLSTTPEDVAKQNLIKKRDSQVREIGETMSGYRRQHQLGGLSDEEYAQRREAQQAKKLETTKKFNERIGLEYR